MLNERIERFTNDGLSFSVTDAGPLEGEVVVLLHGFPQTSTAWAKVSEELHRRGYRTIAPDLRGYSKGARPRGRLAYRSSKIVGDVLALVRALGGGPVHLIGHDWGALLGWSTASAHPEVVRTLTAVSVPHYSAFLLSMLSSNQLIRSYYIVLFLFPFVPELLFRLFPHSFANALRRSGMSAESLLRVQEEIVEGGALTPGINWYRGLLPSNQFTMNRRVTVPTTFVWGDADTLLGPAGAALTHKFVSAPYHLHILPGVSHWVPEEAPKQLARLFIAGAEQAASPTL